MTSGEEEDEAEKKKKDTAYDALLRELEADSQRSYDKAILTLSGGALGISFAFVKDIVGSAELAHPCRLLSAWIFWAASLTSTLISFFTSREALAKAQRDFPNWKEGDPKLGGGWNRATWIFNVVAGIGFLAGVGFMIAFAFATIGG